VHFVAPSEDVGVEQLEYQEISRSIHALLNIDLSFYKDRQMRRRLDSWLARSGARDWDAYFAMLQVDPSEVERFRNYLTINVSQFFRDPLRWKTMSDQILPELLSRLNGGGNAAVRLRTWSAGCSIGAEAYSLAILLHELTPETKHHLLATDIDRGALLRARQGGPYSGEDMREVEEPIRRKYFSVIENSWFVNETLCKTVQFRENDLLKDEPQGRFDLIVCRNVVIYFTQETKDMLFRKFARSLRTGGVLFMGGTEIIPRPRQYGLENRGISLYSKV